MTMTGDRLPVVWGATTEEVAAEYPCTALVPRPRIELWRAVDVDAPSEIVYRWLGQLRVAPYSYDWLDNLGRRSPRELTAGLGGLQVGQRVMTAFRVTSVVPGREFTAAIGPVGRWILGGAAVTYRVVPKAGDASCRLVARLDAVAHGPAGRLWSRILAWGDLVMMRKQLRTLAGLAER